MFNGRIRLEFFCAESLERMKACRKIEEDLREISAALLVR
jgi:hypothetical protein